ncbi:MAG: FtsW/RodA/SpoVE family cell cycle protein [Rikenellaceae bacterium]|nr:FtsW/RodA/SpoVE family cell cycle protein [Rikenellaceae bacterium]
MESGGKKRMFGGLIGGDKTLWMIILILSLFSVLVVYSSTASMAYKKLDGDTSHFLIRQIRFVVLGLAVIYVFHLINYRRYFDKAKRNFRISIFLLLLTFVVGVSYNEAKRWLGIPGTGLTFQPSELVKITLIINTAAFLASKQKIMSSTSILPSFRKSDWNRDPERNYRIMHEITVPLLLPMVLSCVLIMVSNLSTALILALTCFIVLIIGRVKWSEIWRLVGASLVLFVFFAGTLKVLNVGRVDTWMSRVETFFSGEEEVGDNHRISDSQFQAHQAKMAVASGWLMGRGPGNSTQRSNLPHPYSDYAYAFIIEEYGFLGAIFVLGCYLWIFYRSIVIFRKCDTAFPALLVLGLSLTITIQALLHMLVSVDATPVTGQTLPIVSLGGSSLIFTCMSLGIILGVSRRQNELEHRRAVAEKRRLNIEEWQHVMFEEEGAGEIDSTKRIAYQGVVWHNPEDDRESCEEIEEQWNYGDYYDDDEKEEDYS